MPVGSAVSEPRCDWRLVCVCGGGHSAVMGLPGQVEADQSSGRTCPLSTASPCWGQVETERVLVLL